MINIIKQLMPGGNSSEFKKRDIYFALSMGVDSLAAHAWLCEKGYPTIPIHFNHKLRPQNDEMENAFCQYVADRHLPVNYIGYGDKLKTENDCRQARFAYFASIIPQGGVLVTSHHLNDWVEGYLLNCFRGQPDYCPLNLMTNFGNFTVIHPFLLTKKKDFIEFLDRRPDIKKYRVEDETNKDIKGSRRNWIRNVIVQEMTKQHMSLEKFARRQIQGQIEKIYLTNSEY